MEEVDKIIFQSLRQIGCEIDSEIQSLTQIKSDLLVKAVSLCLQQITSNAITLPTSLPQNMAQRFVVATTLAEACTNNGYKNDIGYQTFLYPNQLDVRRLLMFLIEKISKCKRLEAVDSSSSNKLNTDFQQMQQNTKNLLRQQLKKPWFPVFCRSNPLDDLQHQYITFVPQLNLNISTSSTFHQTPSLFQQSTAPQYDLISTVLHKNAMELYEDKQQSTDKLKFPLATAALTAQGNSIAVSSENSSIKKPALNAVQKLEENLAAMKQENQKILAERHTMEQQLQHVKAQQTSRQESLEILQKTAKIKQRSHVVLENVIENMPKLQNLVSSIKGRRQQLQQQWQDYREPLAAQLQQLKSTKQQKHMLSSMELLNNISILETQLREKRTHNAQLACELKLAQSNVNSAISRQDYTRRLLEFTGNIRKQQNDIYKVLQDTRDLQKQINNVDAQLRRQFNYTDDLLFQSAKRDAHAKRAYKLLVSLHASCSKLVELTTLTSNVSKQIRELEVQIDREKDKNVAINLQQISFDIRNIENVLKNIQAEIYKEENKITAG